MQAQEQAQAQAQEESLVRRVEVWGLGRRALLAAALVAAEQPGQPAEGSVPVA